MTRWITICLLVLCAPLAAQPSANDEARRHFERGKQLTSAKDFAHAYDEFAAGYDLTQLPPFLFNMAECERVLHDAPRARELYQRYLAASPQGDLANAARSRLAELGPPPAAPPVVEMPPPVVIPSPKVVAEQLPPPPSPPPFMVEHHTSTPLLRRTSFWIAAGATLVAGSVAIYVVTRHGDTCKPPSCVASP